MEVATFGKILGNFLAHSSTFRCWGSLASFQTWGTLDGGSWNVLITGPPGWGFDVPLATALGKKPSCWEYSTVVEQAKTHKGCSGDWRRRRYVTLLYYCTRVGTLIVATIYLQLIQNRYMFRSFTVLQCSHQHCVQPVASDVEVVGYL